MLHEIIIKITFNVHKRGIKLFIYCYVIIMFRNSKRRALSPNSFITRKMLRRVRVFTPHLALSVRRIILDL